MGVKKIDWIKIKNDYINGKGSYRELADKYSVSANSIGRKARGENWAEQREKQLYKWMLSEIAGKKNTIDALDLASSNMVNNVDEGNLIYWVLSNCGGMDDLDDAKFVERLKTVHVAHADGDDGARAESHTIEAPYQGTQATIDMLKRKLYEDFQCFDASAVSAGNQTATAIKASYVPLDLQTDKFESEVTRFLLGILRIAGIEDKPSYTRNQIINKGEEVQTLLLGAPYYDEEYITKKLLTINGDADQYESMMQRRSAGELGRIMGQGLQQTEV